MTRADVKPVRVLLVDDHAVVRKGMRALLDREPGIEVVGEAGDAEQAVRMVDELRADVTLMDLETPGMGGIEAIRQISSRQPERRIVVLTSHSAEEDVFPALKAGATAGPSSSTVLRWPRLREGLAPLEDSDAPEPP